MNDVAIEKEWLPDAGWGWTADAAAIEGRVCTHKSCRRPAVAMFYRAVGKVRHKRWFCCDNPDHLYGRRVRDGVVEQEYFVGSAAWQRAKARQEEETR